MSLICATTPPGTGASWSTQAPWPCGRSGLSPLNRNPAATTERGWRPARQKSPPPRTRSPWAPCAGTPSSRGSSGGADGNGTLTTCRACPPVVTSTTAATAIAAAARTVSQAGLPDQPCRGRRPRRQRLGSRSGPELIVSTGLSGVYLEDAIDLRTGGMLQIADADADYRAEFHRGPPSIVLSHGNPNSV